MMIKLDAKKAANVAGRLFEGFPLKCFMKFVLVSFFMTQLMPNL